MARRRVGGSRRQSQQVLMVVMSLTVPLGMEEPSRRAGGGREERGKGHKSAGPGPTSTDPARAHGTTEAPGRRVPQCGRRKAQLLGKEGASKEGVMAGSLHGETGGNATHVRGHQRGPRGPQPGHPSPRPGTAGRIPYSVIAFPRGLVPTAATKTLSREEKTKTEKRLLPLDIRQMKNIFGFSFLNSENQRHGLPELLCDDPLLAASSSHQGRLPMTFADLLGFGFVERDE